MTDTLPLLTFHVHERQRLARAPILSPLLIAVKEGEKQVLVDGQPISCPAGHWLALAGRQRLDIVNIPDRQSGHYRAQALGQLDGWQLRLHELFGRQLAGLPKAARACAFVPDQAAKQALARLIELLPGALAGTLQEAQAEHAWQGLMLALAASGQGAALFSLQHRALSEKVVRLLRRDLTRDWQAGEIAAHLAMSAATLRRKLALEGLSFSRLLADARMESALALISCSRQPLGEVAAACGYQSPSRFAAAFQRHFGSSPSALRQMSAAG
ncbi:MAG: helix-turn-helix domain-containing protein [Pseudomonas sp.]